MPLPTQVSRYPIERQVFEAALLQTSPVRYILPDVASATKFRHRANYFRKLVSEAGDHRFDLFTLRLVDNAVIFERLRMEGRLETLTGEQVPVIPEPPNFADFQLPELSPDEAIKMLESDDEN